MKISLKIYQNSSSQWYSPGHEANVEEFHHVVDELFLPYVYDPSTMHPLALPADGDLDRDGLPLISHLTVLSAIHCSTGFTHDTSEGYISDINQRLRNARHVCLPMPWWRWEG